jgi:methylated-DNA-[protein]-cysteine S-methyltransferase
MLSAVYTVSLLNFHNIKFAERQWDNMIKLYHSKIGDVWFGVALEGNELVASTFEFEEEKVLENLLKNLPYNMPFRHERKQTKTSLQIMEALKKIYDGKECSVNFKLTTCYLTPYSKKVLETLSLVSTGYVTTYGCLANVCGGSPRAIGRVMASNPFVLVVPCHRVVHSDLSLGGFGHGVKIKWEILKREDKGYQKPSKLKVSGKNLILYPVKYVKAPS